MTWMVICLAGAIGIGFFGIPYFFANPDVASVVNNEPEQVFIELAKLLFNSMDCRYSTLCNLGSSNEYTFRSIINFFKFYY